MKFYKDEKVNHLYLSFFLSIMWLIIYMCVYIKTLISEMIKSLGFVKVFKKKV